MPQKTWLRVLISMSLFFVGLLAIYLFWRWILDGGNTGPPTLGRQTTAVVDPQYVREDGSISYVRAINDWRSEGVNPADNAFVDLMRALGAQSYPASDWLLAWHAAAGPDVEPPTGPFLGAASLKTQKEIEEYDQSMSRPWRSEEFPQFATYLQTNHVCLDLAVSASKKDQFYSPLIIPDQIGNSMIEALLPILDGARNLARGLKMRAMNHLAHGRTQACLDDLLSTRRIGYLVSQKGLAIEHLVGLAIVQMAIDGEIQAIQSGQLSKAEVEGYLAQLEALPKFNKLSDCVDRAERFCSLDMLQSFGFGENQAGQMAGWTGIEGLSSSFDLDIASEILNDFIDQQVEITQSATFAEQVQKGDSFEETMNQLRPATHPLTIGFQTIAGGNRTRGKLMGNVMATLMLPAVSQLCQADARRVSLERMAFLALHLEHFRIENGEYPASLDHLQLGNHPSLSDPYSNRPIHYQRREHGYQLHVVGANMQDDQGVGMMERDGDERLGDDWKIEIDRSKMADDKTGD